MKQKKMSKKLVLNREMIARLNFAELNTVHGGSDGYRFTDPPTACKGGCDGIPTTGTTG